MDANVCLQETHRTSTIDPLDTPGRSIGAHGRPSYAHGSLWALPSTPIGAHGGPMEANGGATDAHVSHGRPRAAHMEADASPTETQMETHGLQNSLHVCPML